MRKRSLRWITFVVVVGLTACNPGAGAERALEEAIEEEMGGGEVDVDAESGTVTLRGAEGDEMTFTSSEGGIDLPDDFPSTIPVYPDAQVIQYANLGGAVQAGFRIDAAIADVRSWYVEQLEDQDWEIQMNAAMPDGGLISAELGEESLSIMLATEDNETTIIITLTHE